MTDNTRFTHAVKMDGQKPPMDLIPWESMEGVAQVLDFGRCKYQAHNWRKGFLWTRLASAALRHIFSWLSGEDNDKESGLSHIDHATCCLMFLSAHIKSKAMGKDDRAHILLAEDTPKPIPAASVPVHSETVWGVFYVGYTGKQGKYLNFVSGPFVSQDVAQAALIARAESQENNPDEYYLDTYRIKPDGKADFT